MDDYRDYSPQGEERSGLEADLRESETEKEWDEADDMNEAELKADSHEYAERSYDWIRLTNHMPAQQLAECLREVDPRKVHAIKEIITEM